MFSMAILAKVEEVIAVRVSFQWLLLQGDGGGGNKTSKSTSDKQSDKSKQSKHSIYGDSANVNRAKCPEINFLN